MVGQTRAMLEATPPDGRYRETVIDHSNMYHRSSGHVPIHTAIHPLRQRVQYPPYERYWRASHVC
jgi:hypothetical protein